MVGVSFHVGTNIQNPIIYAEAIEAARKVFDCAEENGYHFNLLDIGGGFPGSSKLNIDKVKHTKTQMNHS